jgi:DNA ligase (NAD+)
MIDNSNEIKQSAKNRIEELIELINKYDYAYYVEAQSIITDKEYDLLFRELQDLEKENPDLVLSNSPTSRVGGQALREFESIAHKRPMLSLANTYSKEEVYDFDRKVKEAIGEDVEYYCELKFDGVAISLHYKNFNFDYALTRGDGTKGDNITENAKTIKLLPLQIKRIPGYEDIEVRGEVFMLNSDFAKLNEQQIEMGEKLYANPRNTTAGSLKNLDPKIVASRKLQLTTYNLQTDSINLKSHSDNLAILAEMGFPVDKSGKVCKNINEVISYLEIWNEKRHTLPFETDGVVIKVNSILHQEELGYIARSPKWAVAYKFEAETATTLLNDITLQVGRTGVVTPVAELKPVLLSGSTISRATLHNYDYIKELDLRIGDTVFIEKGGEVIPKVTKVDTSKRDENSIEYEFPILCPCDLKSQLYRPEGEVQYYCNEPLCPWQIKRKIEHFSSRTVMNIDGLGEKVVEQFVNLGYIKDIADLYEIEKFKDEIMSLEGWGEKSYQKLIDGLEKSKKEPFAKVLFGLGIRFIGEGAAKLLSKQFKNIENLISATKEELISVREIGEKMADSILGHFSNETELIIIERLQNSGLQFKIDESEFTSISNKLQGLTFVFTGELARTTRSAAAKLVESMGGKEVKSVSKQTGYVVVGDSPGSKYDKAKQLGIKILNEDEFFTLIESE